MTKSEFIEKVQEYCEPMKKSAPGFTDQDYKLIEKVYTFHPSISETDGKRQVAMLFVEFGMRIFRDMVATAEQAEKIEDEIRIMRIQLSDLTRQLQDLKEGR